MDALPDVALARPTRCRRCGSPAYDGVRTVIHGHGVRRRQVVVSPALDGQPAQVLTCWSRRYRCTRCGTTCTVLPVGLLPRYLYSVPAIVFAWLLIAPAPLGGGLNHRDAYLRQGLFRRFKEFREATDFAWRSVYRWFAQRHRWWPGRAALSMTALLAGFKAQAGALNEEVLARAVASHMQWGAAM